MKKGKTKNNMKMYQNYGDYVMENIDIIQKQGKEAVKDFLYIYIGDNYTNIENCLYILYLHDFVKKTKEEEEKNKIKKYKYEVEITGKNGEITKYKAKNNKEVYDIVEKTK